MTNESDLGPHNKDRSRHAVQIHLPLDEEAQFIVLGGINSDEISSLVSVEAEQLDESTHKVNVGFSIWEDSGVASKQDRQLFVGDKLETDSKGNPIADPIYVYDPYQSWLMAMTEGSLKSHVENGGYFWQVARFIGFNVAVNEFQLEPEQIDDPKVLFNGVKELPEPIKLNFGIDKKVDTLTKYVSFEVIIKKKV